MGAWCVIAILDYGIRPTSAKKLAARMATRLLSGFGKSGTTDESIATQAAGF